MIEKAPVDPPRQVVAIPHPRPVGDAEVTHPVTQTHFVAQKPRGEVHYASVQVSHLSAVLLNRRKRFFQLIDRSVICSQLPVGPSRPHQQSLDLRQ